MEYKNAVHKCIYCLQEKTQGAFTKEHVLPKGFGGFRGALTLVVKRDPPVCGECNSHFGDSIDLVVSRDSFEGLLRLEAGIKQASEVADMFATRVRMQLPEESELGPVHVFPVSSGERDGTGLAPRPQVRFKRKSGGYFCITEAQLKDGHAIPPDVDTDEKTLFWPQHDPDAKERLIGLLEGRGLKFVAKRELAPSDFPSDREADVAIRWTFDSVCARAIAKMAFNYMAKQAGRLLPDFPYRPFFDPVRRFIRYGEGSLRTFVSQSPSPILIGDTPTLRQVEAHVLTLEWRHSDRMPVVGRVSLFNYMTYDVLLAQSAGPLWTELAGGHAYVIKSREVVPLFSGRNVMPVRSRLRAP